MDRGFSARHSSIRRSGKHQSPMDHQFHIINARFSIPSRALVAANRSAAY